MLHTYGYAHVGFTDRSEILVELPLGSDNFLEIAMTDEQAISLARELNEKVQITDRMDR